MKVIRIDEHGGPKVLRLREIELPEPGPGEVLVGLHAAGLNFVDIYGSGANLIIMDNPRHDPILFREA